jgi:hypothetical protein
MPPSSLGAAPAISEHALPAVAWHHVCAVLAVTSAMVGIHWDISWHRSIGRDAFWTPPHVAIYVCGVLAGIAAGYLILTETFGRRSSAAASVRVLGFRGPLGAFILAWGGVAMLTSAPFDDWWHNAYGLDVKIISPPHALLALGLLTVQAGALILVLGAMNRARGVAKDRLTALYLYVGGMMLVAEVAFLMERTDRSDMHSATFYRDIALAVPLVLVGVSTSTSRRWAATTMAGVFTVFQLLLLWILPLFPAAPKLGPVFFPVTHFVPPPFPLLLIVPAAAVDWGRARFGRWGVGWRGAIALGALFFSTYAAAQWLFADFLQTPTSRNWVFGTQYFGYDNRPWWANARNVFDLWETRGEFWLNAGLALALAIFTTWLGLGWGGWLRRIRR